MDLSSLNRLLAPLRNQVANLVARAVVKLVNDSGGLQVMQLGVLAGETRDGCERVQNYGLSSKPVAGAEAVVLFVGGHRDHPLIVAVDDRRYRPTGLEDGDVCLYGKGSERVLLKDGRIVVTSADVRLGSDSAADYVALASLVSTELGKLKTAITNAAVTAGDGGAVFKTNLLAALTNWPASVAAGKVKAE